MIANFISCTPSLFAIFKNTVYVIFYREIFQSKRSGLGNWLKIDACAVKYCVGVFVILTQSEEVQLRGRPHRSICPLAQMGGGVKYINIERDRRTVHPPADFKLLI